MLILEKLSEQEEMTEVEKIIADYFINVGHKLDSQSSRMIAQILYVSPSTISRFCQLVGYSGFNEFKKEYLKEVAYLESNFQAIDPNRPFSIRDKNRSLASKIGILYKETIDDTLNLLQHDSLQKATFQLNRASKIIMVSVGDSYEMAETFKNRLLKIGKEVITDRRIDNLYFQACETSKETCFVLISYSGETEQLLKLADRLCERHLPTIVITSYGGNSLSQQFNTILYLSTREKLVDNLGNFSSLLSISLILDILYASIFNENHDNNYQKRLSFSRSFEKKRISHNPIINDHY